MAVYEYSLGTTAGNITNIEDLSPAIFAPKHTRVEYSKPTPTGDLGVIALGYVKTVWHWDFLTIAQYNKLKTYCTNLSAAVYIKTKKFDETYGYFTATMIWPQQEPEIDNGKVLDVNIEFRKLLEYTP